MHVLFRVLGAPAAAAFRGGFNFKEILFRCRLIALPRARFNGPNRPLRRRVVGSGVFSFAEECFSGEMI